MVTLTQGDVASLRAQAFADGAHCAMKQRRKGTGWDYIVHPEEVCRIVATVKDCTSSMRTAALLHDILEDTGVTKTQIKHRFGDYVAQLVDELTDVSTPEDGNRAQRAAINRRHSGLASAPAQTIKVADIIANSSEYEHLEPSFATVYLQEKLLQLAVLTGADPELHARALRIVAGAIESLRKQPKGKK